MPAPVVSCGRRQAELAELDKLVGGHRLVTITGPGGAGKTRLAIEVTAPLTDDHQDGGRRAAIDPFSSTPIPARSLVGRGRGKFSR